MEQGMSAETQLGQQSERNLEKLTDMYRNQ